MAVACFRTTAEGTLFQQLDAALAFVARNTRQAIKITGQPEREIVLEYPGGCHTISRLKRFILLITLASVIDS